MSTYIEYVHARPEFEEILFELAKGNHFTAADLEANRKGRIGAQQRAYHLQEALLPALTVLIWGLLISFFVRVAYAGYVEKVPVFRYVGTLFGHLMQFQFDRLREAYLTTAGDRLPIIVSAFVLTAPAFAYKKLRHIPFRTVIDLLTGNLKQIEGGIFAVSEQVKAPGRAGKKGEMIENYFYGLKDLKLKVTNEGHKSLVHGLQYRVYYLGTSKQVLSIEPLLK